MVVLFCCFVILWWQVVKQGQLLQLIDRLELAMVGSGSRVLAPGLMDLFCFYASSEAGMHVAADQQAGAGNGGFCRWLQGPGPRAFGGFVLLCYASSEAGTMPQLINRLELAMVGAGCRAYGCVVVVLF
jgi:hypothetical protein